MHFRGVAHLVLELVGRVQVLQLVGRLEHAQDLDADFLADVLLGGVGDELEHVLPLELLAPAGAEQVAVPNAPWART